MTALALLKLLAFSLSLLAALRLFVTIFVGDREAGPAIGLVLKRKGDATLVRPRPPSRSSMQWPMPPHRPV